MMGASVMAGGIIQMLSLQQNGLSAKDSPDNGASYNFNGAVNTSAKATAGWSSAPLLSRLASMHRTNLITGWQQR